MLTKAQLIANVAAMSGVTKTAVTTVLDTLAQEVKQQLAGSAAVTLPGIGKLAPKAKAARIGRNPSTGAEVQIPAKRVVKLKAPADLQNVA